MNKFFLGIIAATIIIIIGGVFVIGGKEEEPLEPPTGYEYYWGDGCPHCAKVAAFMDSWENKDKIDLTKYEIWNNAGNASRMNKRAKECNLSDIGVPLLVKPDGSCVNGDTPIIEYFSNLQF